MRRRSFLLMTCVIVLFLMAGCKNVSTEYQDPRLRTVMRFSQKDLPCMVRQTENRWIYLMNTYGKSAYSLCVGSSCDETNTVYSASGVSIWFLEANEHAAAWCEKTDTAYTYYLYDFQQEVVRAVYTADASEGYQLQNIGLFGRNLYISRVDYARESAGIYSVDMDTLEQKLVLAMPYFGEYSLMSFAVEDHYLSVAGKGKVRVIDLADGNVLQEYTLDESSGYIYAVSFDSENMSCAVYCQHGTLEKIGIFNPDGKFVTLYYFDEYSCAYHDRIVCRDGHIYWAVQRNVSGKIEDHYELVDYNYVESRHVEVDKVFHVALGENRVLLLSFGDGSREVFLSEYPAR